MIAGTNLKDLRLSKGLSLAQVSCSKAYLIQLEHGRTRPGPRLIRRLAEAYSCTTEQIFAAWQVSQQQAATLAEAEPADTAKPKSPNNSSRRSPSGALCR